MRRGLASSSAFEIREGEGYPTPDTAISAEGLEFSSVNVNVAPFAATPRRDPGAAVRTRVEGADYRS